jgi:hypothetical protein
MEVLSMRQSRIWTTVKQVNFERNLILMSRRQKVALRGFVAGKRTR